jgi:cytochrome c oxidase cbb3-type subunit 2
MYCHSQQVRPEGFGADQKRGWGDRGSMPGDYVYDETHQLGTMRTGPDLHDIANRQPSRDWHLAHLYQPRSVSPGSVMPAYPYLFEVKKEANVLPSEVTVPLSAEYSPPGDSVVVATDEALALYEYLMTLTLDPLDEEETSGS